MTTINTYPLAAPASRRLTSDLAVREKAGAMSARSRLEGVLGQLLATAGKVPGEDLRYTLRVTPKLGCPASAATTTGGDRPITMKVDGTTARKVAEAIASQAGLVLINPEALDERAIALKFEQFPQPPPCNWWPRPTACMRWSTGPACASKHSRRAPEKLHAGVIEQRQRGSGCGQCKVASPAALARKAGTAGYTHGHCRETSKVKPLHVFAALTALGIATISHAATTPVLVIHGGSGVIRRGMDAARERDIRAALNRALQSGYAQLKAGKPALDGVAAALTVLEDDPNFNAGKGSVFTHDGRNELDAAIMDGHTLRAGSVAGVHRVKNPILLARAVLEKSQHVMLVGEGAEAFAREVGIGLVDPSYFRTEQRWQQLQKALKEDRDGKPHSDVETAKHFGTVGAVALDVQGRLAAGTSTGGMTDKRWGRVGDSPIIGAGTYANADCAVSGTGWGEFYLRTVAAHAICMRVSLMHVPLERAAAEVINQEIPAMGGNGGAIALDARGNIAMPFNTDGMYRGWIGGDGVAHVAIYDDEADAATQQEDGGE